MFGVLMQLCLDEICTSGKKSKERITGVACVNMTGDEKRPMFAIGHAAKPRCFRRAHIPVDYASNKNAWMTGKGHVSTVI